MEAKLIKQYEVNPLYKDYDYTKFAVFNKNKFITNIYEHDGVFYNLFENTQHKSIESCLTSLRNRFPNKKQ